MRTKEEDIRIMSQIADRWLALSCTGREKWCIMLDLEHAHNTCGLDLPGLLKSEDCDFWHDMAGIEQYMDRDNGTLTDCFLPRYALRQDS